MTRKTRKNLTDKEIKKLTVGIKNSQLPLSRREARQIIKLLAVIKKCQIKNCKSQKWGTKKYRECTKKNCKKSLKKLKL
jgi:hypothetical protein